MYATGPVDKDSLVCAHRQCVCVCAGGGGGGTTRARSRTRSSGTPDQGGPPPHGPVLLSVTATGVVRHQVACTSFNFKVNAVEGTQQAYKKI